MAHSTFCNAAQVILGLTGRVYLTKCSKLFFKFVKNDSKMSLDHLQDSKKLHRTIFNDFYAILDQNLTLTNKVSKIALKYQKSHIFDQEYYQKYHKYDKKCHIFGPSARFLPKNHIKNVTKKVINITKNILKHWS